MYAPTERLRSRQRGLSIIEVMVGMVVSLLVGLAAAGSAVMFTAAQRQGIGTGGSLVNATTALNAIRDDAAAAGLGFFGDSKFLCRTLNLSVEAGLLMNGASFAPIRITAAGTDSRLDIVWGSQVASGANVLLTGSSTGAAASPASLRSLLPAAVGDAVLLAPKEPGADPCVVRSVTAVTASTADTPQILAFDSTGTHNKAAFTSNPTYADQARVALIGELRWARYALSGTDLRYERPLVSPAAAPVVLARNVMAFRAEYGVANAAAGSTALEGWQTATGGFATLDHATLPRVRAVRIGLVTRSPQPEKPNPTTGQCDATTAMPTLFGDAVTADVSNWRCFRYRTVVAVVPLRNLVMGVTP